LASIAEENALGTAKDFEMHVKMTLSVALQVANARLVEENSRALLQQQQRRPGAHFFTQSAEGAFSSPSSRRSRRRVKYRHANAFLRRVLPQSDNGYANAAMDLERNQRDHEQNEPQRRWPSLQAWENARRQERAAMDDFAPSDGDQAGDGCDADDFRPSRSSLAAILPSPDQRQHQRHSPRRKRRRVVTDSNDRQAGK
jgi:hypothetical protein